ncbi:MAG: hypothetical protein ACLGI3_14235 [Actinomycetes bacterium]
MTTFLVLVLVLLATAGMLRRNQSVYRRTRELLDDVHSCGLGDLEAGRDPTWRFKGAERMLVEYDRMVLAFWRPLDQWCAGEPWRSPGPPPQNAEAAQ